jgi:amino acid transporter
MKRYRCRSPVHALVSGVIGIFIFLLVLVLFRFIADYTSWALFSAFVDFLFANAALVVFFSIIFMIADMFETLRFPFDLPFPIIRAVGSVFLVTFIFNIFTFLDSYYGFDLFTALGLLKLILYILVPIVVLIAGYISVAAQFREEKTDRETAPPGTSPCNRYARSPTWDELGNEFRQMIADIIRKMHDWVNGK